MRSIINISMKSMNKYVINIYIIPAAL